MSDSTKFCPGCSTRYSLTAFTQLMLNGKSRQTTYCAGCRVNVQRLEVTARRVQQRRVVAEQQGVTGHKCPQCAQFRQAWEYIRLQGTHRFELKATCDLCYSAERRAKDLARARRVASTCVIDWTVASERACYASIAYKAMTRDQRLWSYIVARRWWLAGGFGRAFGVDTDLEVQRLDRLEVVLRQRGATCPAPTLPPPPYRYADDHADDHAGTVGTSDGAWDRGADRDVEDEEAESGLAAVA